MKNILSNFGLYNICKDDCQGVYYKGCEGQKVARNRFRLAWFCLCVCVYVWRCPFELLWKIEKNNAGAFCINILRMLEMLQSRWI